MTDENKPIEWTEPGPPVKQWPVVRWESEDGMQSRDMSIADLRKAAEAVGLRVVPNTSQGLYDDRDRRIAELEAELKTVANQREPARAPAVIAAEDGDVERIQAWQRDPETKMLLRNTPVPPGAEPDATMAHAVMRATILPASELRLLRECARRVLAVDTAHDGYTSLWRFRGDNRPALEKAGREE